MNTCDTCIFWKRDKNSVIGECDFILDSDIRNNDNTTIEIKIDVSDDSGLMLTVKTGENFGCIKHKSK